MWVIEINFAGRRFTHEVYARRRAFRLRRFGWRPVQTQHPHAA
ncbi:hypothetical protein [Mycobacterium deserti]|uniref:Uncharacterized protein n=1 Tax=Mycobacterium deserti TaxID=2978347 RepID=A0ABT2M9E0_9MYCO|nr:hypothetical protein [Mycobacterium deserti]MCT7658865.1 hypothetical protein [Mycobacterium deserti]